MAGATGRGGGRLHWTVPWAPLVFAITRSASPSGSTSLATTGTQPLRVSTVETLSPTAAGGSFGLMSTSTVAVA